MGQEERTGAFTSDRQHARLVAALTRDFRGAARPGDLLRPRAIGEAFPGNFVPGAEQHGVDACPLGEDGVDQAVGDFADLDDTLAGLLLTHESDFLYATSIEP
ncbi:hypothetical protein D9M70_557090 [compost metagenome]